MMFAGNAVILRATSFAGKMLAFPASRQKKFLTETQRLYKFCKLFF